MCCWLRLRSKPNRSRSHSNKSTPRSKPFKWTTRAPHLKVQQDLLALGPKVVPHLQRAFSVPSEDWDRRNIFVWVMGELGDPSSLPALNKAWESGAGPEHHRVQLAIALASLGNKAPLLSFISNKDANKIVVAKAATSLANVRATEAIPAMLPWLKDEDIGLFVAMALGRLGDESGRALLKPALLEAITRDHAAIALGILGDPTVLFQCRFALENADPFVRRDALRSLATLKDKASEDKLRDMASNDPDPRVRKQARITMGRLKIRARKR